MASRPGVLTEWPWRPLGDFKYLLVASLAMTSMHSYVTSEGEEKDLGRLLIVVLMLWRIVHSQIWISVSRQMTATGRKKIVDKPIEFEQVDRERTWDDQIIFNTLFMYLITSRASPCTRSRWRERRNHRKLSISLTSPHSTPSIICALAYRPSPLAPCGLDLHGTSLTSCGLSLSSSPLPSPSSIFPHLCF
ncbi:Protein CER1-like 1 [Cardamine amara subsp. amara]|uniref:Protein CER1-like 1 n=1 Tax=Cardamine amara subsp. amara TaxID=228776 RepID=A0ABD1ALF2_CARAN